MKHQQKKYIKHHHTKNKIKRVVLMVLKGEYSTYSNLNKNVSIGQTLCQMIKQKEISFKGYDKNTLDVMFEDKKYLF